MRTEEVGYHARRESKRKQMKKQVVVLRRREVGKLRGSD